MLFVEPLFLFLFLPLVLLAERLTRGAKPEHRLFVITASGALFYAAWSWMYLLLLLAAIGCNHRVSLSIAHDVVTGKKRRAKRSLVMAVTGNLFLLGVFKYADFFLDAVDAGMALNLILPLAISFYTFQQIAYVVDVYRKTIKPPRLLTYASYVLFFPQLIAGPIVNYRDVRRDLMRFAITRSAIRYDLALAYFAVGMAKKLLIADPFGTFLGQQQLVMSVGETTPLLSVLTILAYGLQLYFDFSAYGDMALGLGFAFGIRLPINFNAPYKSLNIAAFWRHWHITLGRFLRDYLYIPLGGSRAGAGRTLLNLNIVMLLGGLWHGAAWGYVLWGALHGLALTIHQGYCLLVGLLRRHGKIQVFPASPWVSQVSNALAISLTVTFVFLAWVPFYTESVSDALLLWLSAFSYEGSIVDNADTLHALYGIEIGDVLIDIVVGLALVFFMPTSHELVERVVTRWQRLKGGRIQRGLAHPVMAVVYVPATMVLAKSLLAGPVAAFLYFQF